MTETEEEILQLIKNDPELKGRAEEPPNQILININKNVYTRDSCSVYFKYRDFFGPLENFKSLNSSSLFSELGVDSCWVIPRFENETSQELSDSLIQKIYWTKEYGLTGYEYGNGEFYKRIR